jgi:ABC-2 type transport system permease protein
LLSNNGYVPEEFISALTAGLIMLVPQLLFLMPLYVALVGGDMVAKEAEDGTLRMILSRPISRLRLLVVKWFAGIVFAMLLVACLGMVALVFARILFPWKSMFVLDPDGGFAVFTASGGFQRYAMAHTFMAVNASVMLSIAFMFSCFNMKPAAATILALSCYLVSFVLDSIPFFDHYDNWFLTHHFQSWFFLFHDTVSWPRILESQMILFAICCSAFVAGATAFHVRDIKS